MEEKNNKKLPDSNYRSRPYMIYVWVMFSFSILPMLLAILYTPLLYPSIVRAMPKVESITQWYSSKVEKVEEMRVLSPFPQNWKGEWYAVNTNYSEFDKWFNDNLGLRDLFIRFKNELDYRLFRSSSRVYYGSDNYIYGRTLIDKELPATENVMSTDESRKAIIQGMENFSNDLRNQGVTAYFVIPMQKEYFIENKLPFFAPKIAKDSNFHKFYDSINTDSVINNIDVFSLIHKMPDNYLKFYTQDFHWNHLTAFTITEKIINTISEKEKSSLKWNYKFDVEMIPFLGSDARFSSRLIANEHVNEPTIKKSWIDIHKIYEQNVKQTNIEFVTDSIKEPKLLPNTCMFGNSFSDGMLDVGIVNYFSMFTKLDRSMPIAKVPEVIKGKCKYLIVQILDIQPGVWLSFKNIAKD